VNFGPPFAASLAGEIHEYEVTPLSKLAWTLRHLIIEVVSACRGLQGEASLHKAKPHIND
jgi:hypothetical protein